MIMDKKKRVAEILILVVFVLAISFVAQKQRKVEQTIRMYQEFIDGERTVNGWNIAEISTATREPEKRDETTYTMVDVTGDGIPELHIYGAARGEYVIFSVKDGEMYQFGGFQGYYLHKYYPLENGAFLFREDGRHDYSETYKYFELDGSGEPINEVYFSWVSRDTDYWEYQEKDIYEFDGQACTYEEWYALTRKYLQTTVSGGEAIRNAAEWTRYCTFKR